MLREHAHILQDVWCFSSFFFSLKLAEQKKLVQVISSTPRNKEPHPTGRRACFGAVRKRLVKTEEP